MKFLMIFLSAISSIFMSTAALAHTDHHLGEGSLHAVYHIMFWFIVFAVIYKAVGWYKAKDRNKSQK
jgi:hypothetical protein